MIETIGNIKTKINKKLLDINSDIVKLALHDFISFKDFPETVKNALIKISEEIINKIIKINGENCIIPNDEIYSIIQELNVIYGDDDLMSYKNYLKDN